MSLLPKERTCAICGRKFLGYDMWVYKRGESWLCRYSCLLEFDKKRKRRRTVRNRRLNAEEKREINDLLSVGVGPQRIADRMNISVNAVLYYQKKMEMEDVCSQVPGEVHAAEA